MKKLLWILSSLLIIGLGFLYIVKNPELGISQTILTTLGIDMTDNEMPAVNLTGCISYFDGCNTCMVSGGVIGGCTKMFCQEPAEPQCLEYERTGMDLSGCISYFDGCNNCTIKNGRPSACTEMFCETPSEPKCNEYINTGTEITGAVSLQTIPTEEERKQFVDDRMLIDKYYKAIADKDFVTAVSLMISTTTTAEQLKTKYQNVDKIIPYQLWDSPVLGSRTYTFYIYYTEKDSKESTTYEVTKRIVDGKLENLGSKVRPTVVPEEFLLADSKYQIYQEAPINVLNRFKYENSDRSEFDGLIGGSDPDCLFNPQDPKSTQDKKYQDRLTYFRNLFAKYNEADQMKTYLIKDKTLLYGKSKDSGLVEEAGEGMKIYIMPNKAGYTNKAAFEADFGDHCGITDMFPFAVSQKYLVFIDSCYCGVACPLGCETTSEKIGKVFQLK